MPFPSVVKDVMTRLLSLIAAEYPVMTAGPNPKCAHLNQELLALYQQAMDRFPEMLSQLQAHMTYAAPFEAEFDPEFSEFNPIFAELKNIKEEVEVEDENFLSKLVQRLSCRYLIQLD